MNFMEEINKETQAMLKQISIRKAEKKANAKKRIAEPVSYTHLRAHET